MSLVSCTDRAPKTVATADSTTSSFRSALPSLPQAPGDDGADNAPALRVKLAGDSAQLTLWVPTGAKVNALLPPSILEADGRRFTLSARQITEDSAYFVGTVGLSVPRSQLPIRGILRTSYCRADERLCRSAQSDVDVRDVPMH